MHRSHKSLFLVGALLTWLAATAHANGRFPAARFLTFGAPSTIALGTTFGLVTSTDGGRSWHFTCEEALGFDSSLRWDSAIAISGGAITIGLPDGLAVGTSCGFSRPATAPLDGVPDLTVDGLHLAAALAPVGGPHGIALSDDGGATWRAGWSRPGFDIVTVDIAPGRPQRLYASGFLDGPPALLRSDDGGQTFTPTTAAFADSLYLYIAGVDALDANRLYVRSNLRGGGTALLRSQDGGNTFVELRRTANPMTGVAFLPGGGTLWVGSPGANAGDGVFRSTDTGQTWERVTTGYTTLCLRYREGVLYMCADGTRDPFALGCSTNGGETWNPLLSWQDLIGPEGCPAGSPAHDRCQASWPALRALLARDGGAASGPRGCFPSDTADAGTDVPVLPDVAATPDAIAGPPTAGGCSCNVAPAGRAFTLLPSLVALACLCLTRKRGYRRGRDEPPKPSIDAGGPRDHLVREQ